MSSESDTEKQRFEADEIIAVAIQARPATALLESLTYNRDGEVAQRLVSKLLAFKRER